MIKVRLKCSRCHKGLMDEELLIDSCPSVRLLVKCGAKKGEIHLSSVYGSYRIKSGVAMKKGDVVHLFCPHCKKELTGSRVCEKCAAPMVPLALQEGGLVQVCARRGCKKHLIEFEDPEAEIGAFYAAYPTFFKG